MCCWFLKTSFFVTNLLKNWVLRNPFCGFEKPQARGSVPLVSQNQLANSVFSSFALEIFL